MKKYHSSYVWQSTLTGEVHLWVVMFSNRARVRGNDLRMRLPQLGGAPFPREAVTTLKKMSDVPLALIGKACVPLIRRVRNDPVKALLNDAIEVRSIVVFIHRSVFDR